MLIYVSMELQRRSGSQSASEISSGKYGVCILGFVLFFVFLFFGVFISIGFGFFFFFFFLVDKQFCFFIYS